MTRGPAPHPHPDSLDEEIIEVMTRRRRTLRSAGTEIGVSYQTVKRRLGILERQGLIERDETGKIRRSAMRAPEVTL